MLYRVEGLVIRSTDYGEGNKILTLFTASYGKIGVVARGAKKMNSRHSAVSQLFTYGEFVFYRAGSQLGTLNSAEIVTSHRRLREDLLLSAYASYLTELTDRLIGDNEAQPWIYQQLKLALEGLEDGKDAQIVTHIYEMKMLALAGYEPNLKHCANCGATSDHPVISIRLGGMLCERCEHQDAGAIRIGAAAFKLLRVFKAMDLGRLGKIEVKEETKALLKPFMRDWFDAHVDIRFRSRSVLDQMEKYGW